MSLSGASVRDMTPQQKQAVISLSQGMPAKEVADALGLSLRTLQRWKTQPQFKAEMQRLERESGMVIATQVVENVDINCQFVDAASRALSLMSRAVDVMEATLNNPDARVSDRLKVVQLLGKWNGFELDFNVALASLRRYGLILRRGEDGKWEVVELD